MIVRKVEIGRYVESGRSVESERSVENGRPFKSRRSVKSERYVENGWFIEGGRFIECGVSVKNGWSFDEKLRVLTWIGSSLRKWTVLRWNGGDLVGSSDFQASTFSRGRPLWPRTHIIFDVLSSYNWAISSSILVGYRSAVLIITPYIFLNF